LQKVLGEGYFFDSHCSLLVENTYVCVLPSRRHSPWTAC